MKNNNMKIGCGMLNLKLNDKVKLNFINTKKRGLVPPLIFLGLLSIYFLFVAKGNFNDRYINIQKDLFFVINNKLSQYTSLQFNLTQLGDILISFSILSIFSIYASKLWEALITSALLTLLISSTLKEIFTIPRPAVIFDNDSFTIIGRTHSGLASLPSGHSIATFSVITVLLYAFMPKKKNNKIFWVSFMIVIGLIISFSRVAVGAHFPLDVIIGSAIGFIVAFIGIKISNQFNWLSRIESKTKHLIYLALFVICIGLIIQKLFNTNLFIFYLSIFSLIITLCLNIIIHVKKN